MDTPGFPIESCTLSTCSLKNAQVEYQPNLGGNVFFVTIFSCAIILQVFNGLRYRTWGFMLGMFCGLVLEIVGYVARIQMHFNPFLKGPFIMYLVALTIGPTFFTASIYLCLARLIVVFGEHLARFKPRTYTLAFITSDVISLVLQAIGGGKASGAQEWADKQVGIHVMVAGLALQVASLVVFTVLCLDFIYSVRKAPVEEWEPMFKELRSESHFKGFLWSLALTTLLILIRSSFRVAELSEGFGSALANDEVTFMVLEGGMVATAVVILTIAHPGIAFGREAWKDAGWSFSGKKVRNVAEKEKIERMKRSSV